MQISNNLFEEAKKLAQRERRTLKALVEKGLRRIISDRKKQDGFRLRKATFKGNGIQPHLANASWEGIRILSYKR
jgi:hypothetical protein